MMIIILALNINDGLGISECDSVNILFFCSRYYTKGHGREPRPTATPWMRSTFPSLEQSMPTW